MAWNDQLQTPELLHGYFWVGGRLVLGLAITLYLGWRPPRASVGGHLVFALGLAATHGVE